MIESLRTTTNRILVAGNHPGIVQSILDFDYAGGKESPSIYAIISSGRKSQKFFWGDTEILIPVYDDLAHPVVQACNPTLLLSLASASSTTHVVRTFFETYPHARAAHIFAENVSERDALSLSHVMTTHHTDALVAGPSGVGLLIPGHSKLGAIGGIEGPRVADLGRRAGSVAVVCSSGGMVNELIYQVTERGAGVSFAVAYGGDRFPITEPLAWILEAERDPRTTHIVYFGELGGEDEYAIAEAVRNGHVAKPIIAYIAGRYESKDSAIQFGHAKALAESKSETAAAKSEALRAVGIQACDTFAEFLAALSNLPHTLYESPTARSWQSRPSYLKATLFSSPHHTASDADTFSEAIVRRILGKNTISHELVSLCDAIFRELLDHGPNVSGAANTIVTARAGKDMVSALSAGLLTIGPRFGGAINAAAHNWQSGVSSGVSAEQFVKDASTRKEHILGIGHLKYNIYRPDPRIASLFSQFHPLLSHAHHTQFAEAVAAITSRKKQNLILNVDGAVAALMLDMLSEKEGFSPAELRDLIDAEFFNALFVIARSVGFVGNYLDQKRIDEGLFRLRDSDIHFF